MFCRACIDRLSGDSECPLCKEHNFKENCIDVPQFIVNKLNELQVECKMCKGKVSRGSLGDHQENYCPHTSLLSLFEELTNVFESNFNEKIKEFKLKEELLNQRIKQLETQVMERETIENNKPIHLNVRGSIITVSLEDLINNEREPDNLFKKMFNGEYPLFKAPCTTFKDEVYFIDCDPIVFKYIIDWLQFGIIDTELGGYIRKSLIYSCVKFGLLNIAKQLGYETKDKKVKDLEIENLIKYCRSNNQTLSLGKCFNRDLQGLDFSGMNLKFINFKGCNLRGCTFSNCCLSRVDFKKCNLRETNFSNCIFKNCLFESSNLRASLFNDASSQNQKEIHTEPQPTKITFKSIERQLLSFIDCNLNECQLENVQFECLIKQCDLSSCIIQDSNFSKSIISNTKIDNCRLINANFSIVEFDSISFNKNLHDLDFSNATFNECDFNNSNLSSSNFTKCFMMDCSLENANMKKTNFSNSKFYNCKFNSTCNFEETILNNCLLYNVSGLVDVRLIRVDFSNCKLYNTVASCSYISNSNISQSKFEIILKDQKLIEECDLSGCIFSNNYTGIQFNKVIFGKANIKQAKFDNCIFRECDLRLHFTKNSLNNCKFIQCKSVSIFEETDFETILDFYENNCPDNNVIRNVNLTHLKDLSTWKGFIFSSCLFNFKEFTKKHIENVQFENDVQSQDLNDFTFKNTLFKDTQNVPYFGLLSTILNNYDRSISDQLISLTKSTVIPTLLYRGTRDKFQNSTFNAKCYDQGAILIIIESEHNQIFGGFISKYLQATRMMERVQDDRAFLFQISNNQVLHFGKIPGTVAYVHNTFNDSLKFGGDMLPDLEIKGKTIRSDSTQTNYELPKGLLLAGSKECSATEIEVFKIQ